MLHLWITGAYGPVASLAHSERDRRRAWLSEVTMFTFQHHHKAVPGLFGIPVPARAPL